MYCALTVAETGHHVQEETVGHLLNQRLLFDEQTIASEDSEQGTEDRWERDIKCQCFSKVYTIASLLTSVLCDGSCQVLNTME